MRYGTVCSGVEAFGPAWEALGYTPVFHAEIATHPSAVLRYHYPEVPNYGDFTKINAADIDLLAGGTPCQDFSVAGLRKGLAGKRGNLTLEFAGLAERLRPRWLVWENVPGVLSADGGRAFGQFLTLLAECGYYAAYRVLDAQHFGVPQRRRRVFLVAYLGDWRPAAAVLFESESLRRDIAPSRSQAADITGTIEASLGRSRGAGTPVAALTANGVGTCGADDNQAQAGHIVVSTLTTSPYADNEAQESRLIVATAEGQQGLPSLTVSNTSKQANNQQPLVYQQQGSNVGPSGTLRKGNGSVTGGVPFMATQAVMPCLTASKKAAGSVNQQDASNGAYLVAAFKQGAGAGAGSIGYAEELAPTLTGASSGTQQSPALLHSSAVRRLTPLECERLMGYPDNWTRYGVKPNGTQYEVADGPRYQMCGNGWATPVANWVAQRIAHIDNLITA